MPVLLVQSCSGTKIETETPVEALDLYDGYFYRIIKKANRENELRDDLEIVILSAEHGLLDSETAIATYDRRMTPQRAEELRPEVVDSLVKKVDRGEFDAVVVNTGADYRAALEGIEQKLHIPVYSISGDGIGTKGSKLHQFIRGDETTISQST